MNFKPAQCPSCGGALRVPDDRPAVNCMYCGVSIVVREAVQAAAVGSVPNLLRLAQTGLASSNYNEAYQYFTRVLEIDANNTHAWAGKAEAVGHLTDQHAFRLPEMLNYFANAIASADQSQLNHIQRRAADVICTLVSQDYVKMRSALSPAFFENANWTFYVNHVGELLTVLETANRLIPTDSKIPKAIIWLCDQNTNGVSFVNALGKPGRRFDPVWSASLNKRRETYLQELYRVEPALRPAAPITTIKTSSLPIDRRIVFVALGSALLIGLVMLAAFVSVSTSKPPVTERAPAITSQTPATAAANVTGAEQRSTSSSFATVAVCSLPSQVSPNTPFSKLGGGRWRKWSDAGGELDHACEGGTDLIKLENDGTLDITAEYSVLGNAQSAHYISAEYMAFTYSGVSEVEKAFRQRYADFCDRLAMKLYGKRLSQTFKNRLLNESTYSKSGATNSYPEKIGVGFITVSANKNERMVMLDVHFFPSETDFKTYKDS